MADISNPVYSTIGINACTRFERKFEIQLEIITSPLHSPTDSDPQKLELRYLPLAALRYKAGKYLIDDIRPVLSLQEPITLTFPPIFAIDSLHNDLPWVINTGYAQPVDKKTSAYGYISLQLPDGVFIKAITIFAQPTEGKLTIELYKVPLLYNGKLYTQDPFSWTKIEIDKNTQDPLSPKTLETSEDPVIKVDNKSYRYQAKVFYTGGSNAFLAAIQITCKSSWF